MNQRAYPIHQRPPERKGPLHLLAKLLIWAFVLWLGFIALSVSSIVIGSLVARMLGH